MDRGVPAVKMRDWFGKLFAETCDPYWPRKTVEGREPEILRCVYCNKCKEADEAFQKVYCAQWKKKEGSFEVRSHRRHSSRI
jgi:hypothetical protein